MDTDQCKVPDMTPSLFALGRSEGHREAINPRAQS